MRRDDTLTVVSNNPYFQFTPSNPWAAVGRRTKKDITIVLASVFKKKGINFFVDGVTKLDADGKKLVMESGQEVSYDYLIIATGPGIAFDEIEGLGPQGFAQSFCAIDHAADTNEEWEKFCANRGAIVVGAVQGASCYGPGLRICHDHGYGHA